MKTNRDMLNEYSDEDLAFWITKEVLSDYFAPWREIYDKYLQWLKSPITVNWKYF